MPIGGGVVVEGIYDAYVCIRDKKAQGVSGGTFTVGAWQTRDLNDEVADTANIASVSSNQITLAAGTYVALILAPAHAVANHQSRLYDITGGATLITGTPEYVGVTELVQTHSFVCGRFTLAATSVLEVQHYATSTKSANGLGIAGNITNEIYTVAQFWREAS